MLDLSNDQAAGLRRILGTRKSRYVSVLTALEPSQKNLVLLNLAAADVQDLTPGPGGGVGPTWLGLAATGLLLNVARQAR